MGWGLKNVVCEGAYSQFEIDFDYSTVLGMADRDRMRAGLAAALTAVHR